MAIVTRILVWSSILFHWSACLFSPSAILFLLLWLCNILLQHFSFCFSAVLGIQVFFCVWFYANFRIAFPVLWRIIWRFWLVSSVFISFFRDSKFSLWGFPSLWLGLFLIFYFHWGHCDWEHVHYCFLYVCCWCIEKVLIFASWFFVLPHWWNYWSFLGAFWQSFKVLFHIFLNLE